MFRLLHCIFSWKIFTSSHTDKCQEKAIREQTDEDHNNDDCGTIPDFGDTTCNIETNYVVLVIYMNPTCKSIIVHTIREVTQNIQSQFFDHELCINMK